jgi:hypothetical protein
VQLVPFVSTEDQYKNCMLSLVQNMAYYARPVNVYISLSTSNPSMDEQNNCPPYLITIILPYDTHITAIQYQYSRTKCKVFKIEIIPFYAA